MKQNILEATENDYPRLKHFAEKVGVVWEDSSSENTRFLMLEKNELAASIGVKMVENWAILRALIIDPEQCGLGESMHLLNSACEKAREMGAVAAYLVTAVPSYIFQLSGFTEVAHSDIPESLLNHPPFNHYSEVKSASVMMRFLNN